MLLTKIYLNVDVMLCSVVDVLWWLEKCADITDVPLSINKQVTVSFEQYRINYNKMHVKS